MRVQIVTSRGLTSSCLWYKKYVGKTYKVRDHGSKWWKVSDGNSYPTGMFIRKCDAVDVATQIHLSEELFEI